MKQKDSTVSVFLRFCMLFGLCGFLAFSPVVVAAQPLAANEKARDAAGLALEPLKNWADKYPFDKIKGKDFWEQESLQKSLQIVLGPTRYDTFLRKWADGVSEPVAVKADLLHAWLCKAHACNTDYMHLFINFRTSEIAVCWSESDDQGRNKADMWLSSRQKGISIAVDGCDKYQGFDLYYKYGAMP